MNYLFIGLGMFFTFAAAWCMLALPLHMVILAVVCVLLAYFFIYTGFGRGKKT